MGVVDQLAEWITLPSVFCFGNLESLIIVIQLPPEHTEFVQQVLHIGLHFVGFLVVFVGAVLVFPVHCVSADRW